MTRPSWRAIVAALSMALILLSLILPLHSFPAGWDGRPAQVHALGAIRADPLLGLVFLFPLLAFALIRMRLRRLMRATGLVLAPLLLAFSAVVAYAHSATDLRVESMVWPLSLFLPSIWTPSTVGAGCWALVAANALLLVLWGGAIARRNP